MWWPSIVVLLYSQAEISGFESKPLAYHGSGSGTARPFGTGANPEAKKIVGQYFSAATFSRSPVALVVQCSLECPPNELLDRIDSVGSHNQIDSGTGTLLVFLEFFSATPVTAVPLVSLVRSIVVHLKLKSNRKWA